MNYNARKMAVDILNDVYYKGAYSNIVLNKYFKKHDININDKKLITQIVYGTLQNTYYIDYIINIYSKVKTKKLKPLILLVLRISIYQLLFLDKIPPSAVCNEAVKIIKSTRLKNLSGFVNGVLRGFIRNEKVISFPDSQSDYIKYLHIKYSFPEWLIELWLNQFSNKNEIEYLLESLNRTPSISIRCNTLKINRDTLMEKFIEEGLDVKKSKYSKNGLIITNPTSINKLFGYKEGYFTVQDESSMLVSQIANPQKGDLVVDLCAAPGGKATGIAQEIEDDGKIIARDIHEHKLELIKENSDRLGIKSIETQLFDATQLDNNLLSKADIVLADVPCSGLGIIHKKPDIKLTKGYEDINKLISIQRQILDTASHYVKEKGVLVYSTCTINKEENEQNVKWFLSNYPFKLDNINKYLPDKLTYDTIDNGYIQLLPHKHMTDGFFIARFIRKD